MRTLEEETAREIYVTRYLAGPRIDTLPPAIVPQLFDMAVNHGPQRAVRILQGVLGLAGWPVDVDGVVGPETRQTTFDAQAEMGPFLANAIANQRANFYHCLVAADPSQRVFLRGWNLAILFLCSLAVGCPNARRSRKRPVARSKPRCQPSSYAG